MTALKNFIVESGATQKDIAAAFGISRPYLSLLASHVKRPSLDLALRIARLTGGAVPVASWVRQEAQNEDRYKDGHPARMPKSMQDRAGG